MTGDQSSIKSGMAIPERKYATFHYVQAGQTCWGKKGFDFKFFFCGTWTGKVYWMISGEYSVVLHGLLGNKQNKTNKNNKSICAELCVFAHVCLQRRGLPADRRGACCFLLGMLLLLLLLRDFPLDCSCRDQNNGPSWKRRKLILFKRVNPLKRAKSFKISASFLCVLVIWGRNC